MAFLFIYIEGDETIAVSQQEVSVDGQPLSAQNKEKLVQKKKPKVQSILCLIVSIENQFVWEINRNKQIFL